MKKPFNKALAASAVAGVLISAQTIANPINEQDLNNQVENEIAAFQQAKQEMAFGLIVKKPGVQANTKAMQSMASTKAVERLNAVMGAKAKHKRFMFNGAQVLNFESGMKSVAQLERMAAKLRAQGYEVDVDRMLTTQLTPNDTHYGVQWHYSDATGGINAPAAWDVTTGSGVKVAVLDTGYRPHADLTANIVGGYDFITSGTVSRDSAGRDSDARDEGD